MTTPKLREVRKNHKLSNSLCIDCCTNQDLYSQRYDVLLSQGVKEYTSEDIKADEEREASGETTSQFRSSFDIFEEVERMTDAELAQAKQEKAVLLALGLGFIGMTAYFALKNRKIRKMIGFPLPGTVRNVNESKELQAAIGQDRERQLAEMEKLRLKEERERAHAERVFENVQKRREALAAAELEREEAEREEREKQKAIERARREAERQEALERGENVEAMKEIEDGDSEIAAHDLNGVVAQKAQKQANFRCQPCKKSFKSEEQLENHLESNKHKQVIKDAERAAKKPGKASN